MKTINIPILFLSILISSCNISNENKSKIQNLSKEQVYSEFENWLKSKNSFNEEIKDTFNVILTDVNNDGFLDGLVDFNEFVPVNGNAFWNLGYPYFENTDSGLKYISTLDGEIEEFPRLKRINFVSNTGGHILVNATRYKPDEANCCPSIEREEIYILKDGKFVIESKTISKSKNIINSEELSTKLEGEWTSECILDIYYKISIQQKNNKFYFDIKWGYDDSKGYIINSNGAINADKIINNNDGSYTCFFSIAGKLFSLKLNYQERNVITATILSNKEEKSSIVLYNCAEIKDQDEFFRLENKYRIELYREPLTNGIYPFTSQRLLNTSDLRSLTKQDLKIMRNEIYARHGYKFKTSEMINYFLKQSWYEGKYDDVTTKLSTIEKKNIELIKKHE